MKILTALRCAASLCALSLLASCSASLPKPPPVTPIQAPQVIDVPTPAYAPVPAPLTTPIPEPKAPEARCTYAGVPAVCVLDMLTWIENWRAALLSANDDRATTSAISAAPAPASASSSGER